MYKFYHILPYLPDISHSKRFQKLSFLKYFANFQKTKSDELESSLFSKTLVLLLKRTVKLNLS